MLISVAKRALGVPLVFETYQSFIGAPACHKRFIREYVRPCVGEAILDVGCGTGVSLDSLPKPITYVGVDLSESYIRRACAQHGDEGAFFVADATVDVPQIAGPFDRAFAFGVLHHISDKQVAGLIGNLAKWLKPGGSFTSIDPCFTNPQNVFARYLISNDRGQFVRTPEALRALFSDNFTVDAEVVTNMLRIPYTQVILRAKPLSESPRRA
jgi:cyclopropane fatty-acyl-phospholipid synthase-like methyltransferase